MSTATESSFIQGARAWIWDELMNRASTGVQQSVTFTFTATPFVDMNQQKVLIVRYIIPLLEQSGYRCRLFSVQHASYLDLTVSRTDFNTQDRSEDTIDDVSKNPFLSSSDDDEDDEDDIISSDDEDLDDDDDDDKDLEDEDAEDDEDDEDNEDDGSHVNQPEVTVKDGSYASVPINNVSPQQTQYATDQSEIPPPCVHCSCFACDICDLAPDCDV